MRQNAFAPEKTFGGGPASSQGNQAVAEFEALAMPIVNSAYNLARWLARNDHDAEDLVQETYLKAFRSFASFQPGTNFRAWIFRILRNTFLSSCPVRERQLMVGQESEEQVFPTFASCTTPESLLIDSSSIAVIRDAIQHLPTIYREVILLCDVEDATYREIAEILSIPIGTVMSRLARARRMVREALRPGETKPAKNTTGRLVKPTSEDFYAHEAQQCQ
ncbi:MAG: sigma-70 family RNA polymerase sigma factor [Terracidiphilus sp.]|jgi:RNA polymerase sigma-70 factor (ECF subfamily)